MSPHQAIKLVSYTSNTISKNLPSFEAGRKLMFNESPVSPQTLTLNSKIEDDAEMKDEANEDQSFKNLGVV